MYELADVWQAAKSGIDKLNWALMSGLKLIILEPIWFEFRKEDQERNKENVKKAMEEEREHDWAAADVLV